MEIDSILNKYIQNALSRLILLISVLIIKYIYSSFADNNYRLYEI